jgi:hypothetical protein
MRDEKVVDLARRRALARGERTAEETDAWATEIEARARRLYSKNAREPFRGFCTVVFDPVKKRPCVLLGPESETRVVARYNIGKDDGLRPVKPTERDDELLARYRGGVF